MRSRGSKWDQVNASEIKWVQVRSSEFKWVQVNPRESKWVQVKSIESKWDQVSPSESKWVQVRPSESKWNQWELPPAAQSSYPTSVGVIGIYICIYQRIHMCVYIYIYYMYVYAPVNVPQLESDSTTGDSEELFGCSDFHVFRVSKLLMHFIFGIVRVIREPFC